MSGVRELVHPLTRVEVDPHREGARITFYVPQSRLGSVQVVLSDDEWRDLSARVLVILRGES